MVEKIDGVFQVKGLEDISLVIRDMKQGEKARARLAIPSGMVPDIDMLTIDLSRQGYELTLILEDRLMMPDYVTIIKR